MQQAKTAFILLLLLTVLTGIFYPLMITGIAQYCFPWQANGSVIKDNDESIGSQWIGQFFSSPDYFWGRPSMTDYYPYNGLASSGSNSGPSNPIFLATVDARVNYLKAHHAINQKPIPIDLVTASGSGLDPDISPSAAFYQVSRVAKARNLSEDVLIQLIKNQTKSRTLGVLGEPRVNVLQLNLALNHLGNKHVRSTR
ncbi:MAG: potassium-transporting ATPase subunit KdpC [Legionellaceae bacterium]|nr:potassium-transporting ATPase subunit KdpC [Legionellaceae bacterium]